MTSSYEQQLAIARALVTRPSLLILDEPTEGIQPSIIKDIERVIRSLAERGDMAILLVEQYFEFARDLAGSDPSGMRADEGDDGVPLWKSLVALLANLSACLAGAFLRGQLCSLGG